MVDPNTAATLTVDAIWELCDAMTAAHGDPASALTAFHARPRYRQLRSVTVIRRRLCIALIAVLAFVLAACGGGGDSESSSGPTEIQVWHGYQDTEGKAFKGLVDQYNKDHPDAKVSELYSSNDLVLQKVYGSARHSAPAGRACSGSVGAEHRQDLLAGRHDRGGRRNPTGVGLLRPGGTQGRDRRRQGRRRARTGGQPRGSSTTRSCSPTPVSHRRRQSGHGTTSAPPLRNSPTPPRDSTAG